MSKEFKHLIDNASESHAALQAMASPRLEPHFVKTRYPIKYFSDLNHHADDWRVHFVNHSPAHLFLIDDEQKIIHINYIKKTLESKQIIGSNLRDWVCDESLPQYDWAIEQLNSDKHIVRVMVHCKDDSWWWFSLGPKSDFQGQTLTSILAFDITEQKLENDASARERFHMASLNKLMLAGQMSAAVSHEIAQPLSAIANYIDSTIRTLRNKYEIEEKDLENLKHSLGLVVRAGEVTKSTRTLMRKTSSKTQTGNLHDAIDRTVRMLKELAIAKNINVKTSLVGASSLVRGSTIIIEQIVNNLLTNAIEAIDHGQCQIRNVNITTSIDERGMIHMIVNDTGKGMHADIAAVLFKPFHTSKPEGLGMGLWICRNLIRKNGGEITLLQSNENGTAFDCCFQPASDNR